MSHFPVNGHSAEPVGAEVPRRVGPLLTDALASQWQAVEELLRSLRRKVKPGRIHDARVGIRRLNATLALIHETVHVASVMELRKALKQLLKKWGPLRDAQVHETYVGELMDLFPELGSYHKNAARRARRLRDSAGKVARATGIGKLSRLQQHIVEEVSPHWSQGLADRQRTQAMEAVDKSFAAVVEARQNLDMVHLDTVHSMRKAFKRFRYMVEVLQPLLSGVGAAQLNSMHAFQSMMGDIHDLDFISADLAHYRQKRKHPSRLAPAHDEIAHRLLMATDNFMAASDELFSFWDHAWIPE